MNNGSWLKSTPTTLTIIATVLMILMKRGTVNKGTDSTLVHKDNAVHMCNGCQTLVGVHEMHPRLRSCNCFVDP